MSHIQSHHGGAEGEHNTFLVILKVHGDAIHLWSRDLMQTVGKTRSFRISCHSVDASPASCDAESDIRVFTLNDPASIVDKCIFQDQVPHGQLVRPGDLAIFMTGPVPSGSKASYAIDLALSENDATPEDLIRNEDGKYEPIGRTYLYLDPEFSSQGIQRTPVLAKKDHVPVGQIQFEYLIITNPVGYGVSAPKPDWLFCESKLDVGHRGSGSGRRIDLPEKLLENTIDSFNYAHRNGADMCELDVLITADGIPIVYHDFDVDAVAAQQSSDELGKFRVQVNQFTYKQLRDFRLLALHDGEGCPYTLSVPKQAEGSRPFPKLADVLDQVDETCGFNIEIKWPQMLESRKMEARRFREINDFVERIIDVIERHAANRHRIILESFDADLVIMLRLKQNRFPVVFLSQGMTDLYERYMDTRARSVWNGIYFAQAFDLAGIDLIAEYYLTLGQKLVDFIKDHNLVARSWGDMGSSPEKLAILKSLDLQCVTYDRIDKMKQLLN